MRSKVAQRIFEETPLETKILVRKYAEIVSRVHEIMKAQGINQADLALKMGKNPSELSRWLKGDHNLTLRSLAKLEAELGEEIITVPLKGVVFRRLPQGHVKATHLPTKGIWRVIETDLQQSPPETTAIA